MDGKRGIRGEKGALRLAHIMWVGGGYGEGSIAQRGQAVIL